MLACHIPIQFVCFLFLPSGFAFKFCVISLKLGFSRDICVPILLKLVLPLCVCAVLFRLCQQYMTLSTSSLSRSWPGLCFAALHKSKAGGCCHTIYQVVSRSYVAQPHKGELELGVVAETGLPPGSVSLYLDWVFFPHRGDGVAGRSWGGCTTGTFLGCGGNCGSSCPPNVLTISSLLPTHFLHVALLCVAKLCPSHHTPATFSIFGQHSSLGNTRVLHTRPPRASVAGKSGRKSR
jgi:hypothetical protein